MDKMSRIYLKYSRKKLKKKNPYVCVREETEKQIKQDRQSV